MLANRWYGCLGLNSDGRASYQGKYRRRTRLGLSNGALFGDDKPVPGGEVHTRASGNRLGLYAQRANCTGEPYGEHGRHVAVGIEPFGNVLGDGVCGIHASFVQDGEHGFAHGVACPRHAGGQFASRAISVDNLRVKELVRLVCICN